MIKVEINNIKTNFCTTNKNTLWEFAKCKIRTETILFSSIKSKTTNEKLLGLESQLKTLEKDLENNPTDITHSTYLQCEGEWEKILQNKADGIKLRSKAKWMEEGEKNTKYFLNLEKRNYNSTCIKKLIIKDEQERTNVKDIIQEQENFYKDLYSSKIEDNQSTTVITNKFINSAPIPLLEQLNKDLCDSELTLEECSKALKELANNKSPGSDGFTTNFYKTFWPDIKLIVYDSYTYSLNHNLLSQKQTRYNQPHSEKRQRSKISQKLEACEPTKH